MYVQGASRAFSGCCRGEQTSIPTLHITLRSWPMRLMRFSNQNRAEWLHRRLLWIEITTHDHKSLNQTAALEESDNPEV